MVWNYKPALRAQDPSLKEQATRELELNASSFLLQQCKNVETCGRFIEAIFHDRKEIDYVMLKNH